MENAQKILNLNKQGDQQIPKEEERPAFHINLLMWLDRMIQMDFPIIKESIICSNSTQSINPYSTHGTGMH